MIASLQNLDSLAFLLLGVAVGIGWARNRDRSQFWLALAIVLLSLVSVLGRVPIVLHVKVPLLSELSLLAFAGSGYALFRYRASLIPLPDGWHAVAGVAIASASLFLLVATEFAASSAVKLGGAVVLILIWSAMVMEPIVRFWLLSRHLPSVQAWRIRSLGLGFGGIVLILLIVVAATSVFASAAARVGLGLAVLLIAPILYVSFSPPAWLRLQWRANEEEGLMSFMHDLARLSDDPAVLTHRMLEWTMRLTGGNSAVAFDEKGRPIAACGLKPDEVAQIKAQAADLGSGLNRVTLSGSSVPILLFDMGFTRSSGRLAVLAGPFTPGFGSDEMLRLQQFIVAVVSALDRVALLDRLKDSNARLIEANSHKSIFLASMSHELRTPLNSILGFSELLLDSEEGQFPKATERRFLDQIHSSGKHLLGIINDILDLSKIEAGQMELRLQTVSVAEIVKQAITTAEPLAAQNQITLQPDGASAGEIEVDAGKLKQMLLNLLSNAIKFTLPGGSVSVIARRLDDAVEIAVTDTGIGIAAADQDRIFDEFQQVDSSVGRQRQGTGLGLSLTRRFALLHGGNIQVESELGTGSTFTLRLPLQQRRPEAGVPARKLTADLDGGRTKSKLPLVMVVEDDAASAELLVRQLHRAGFRSEVVAKGAEVLSKAKELKPQAITLDILLPDVDGWEVLNRLKADEEARSIPVIVISILDNPELAGALGALDYILKPVTSLDLLDRLQKLQFQAESVRGQTTVLVVDDEAANRDWLASVLKPAGFGVVEAAGGLQAIELAKAAQPSLVLLDLMMPEVTGFDVVERLKADAATRQIPIIVLTAKDLTDADMRQLKGRVMQILSRGSIGASDLIEWLRFATGEPTAAATLAATN